jgi:predicted transcriptional regulator
MIDFACKTFNVNEVIKCGLGLTKSDFNILNFLMNKKDDFFTSEQIAIGLEIDLSTAQRSLKKLRDKKLVIRRQINLSPGGYVYNYRCQDKLIIKDMVNDLIKSWSDKVDNELNKWILK